MSALRLLSPRRREEARALTRASLPGSLFPTTVAGPSINARNALQLVDVLACCRLLAETAATLPLQVFRRTDAGRLRVTSGRLVELLRRPSPGRRRRT